MIRSSGRGAGSGSSPGGCETLKFSTDPELEAKIRDVVGLYLHPPENAVVLSVDEKSQVQALDRTAPMLPMRSGIPERQTYDYVRPGTPTRQDHPRLRPQYWLHTP